MFMTRAFVKNIGLVCRQNELRKKVSEYVGKYLVGNEYVFGIRILTLKILNKFSNR